MDEINLFPDQRECINGIRQSIKRGNRSVLLQAGTGSGKTYMASEIVSGAFRKGKRCLFVVPRRELLRQTSSTFSRFGIDHSFIAAGLPYNQFARIYIASKDTLVRRISGAFDVTVIDECHYGGAGVDKIVQHYRKGGILIGLSATPWDMAGRGMAHQYEDMVQGRSIDWLIRNKRLSEYKAFAPDHVDLSGIRHSGGEYNSEQVSDRMRSAKIFGNAARHYKQHATGMRGVTFLPSVKESERMAQLYRDCGVPAAHMDGNTPDDERKRISVAFARRELLQICNAELLTFGYDLAAASGIDACVEVVSDCQPTRSLAKQMQKWGRGLRYDGRLHMFFDHANNFDTHGLPRDHREWTLEPREKRGGGNKEASMPVRECSKCFYCHRPAPVCPNCGYEYPYQGRTVEEVEAELKEVESRNKRVEVGRAKTLSDLRKIAQERGYKPQWVWRIAKAKGIKE